MPEIPPRQLALYGLGLLAVVVLALWYLGHAASSTPRAGGGVPLRIQSDSGRAGGGLTVHVAGAVRRPGVYRLRAGTRVDDAVRRAGGARSRADLSALNLAAKLEDGRQVLVPIRAPALQAAAVGSAEPGAAAAGSPAVPINLNTATPEQLDALQGIGPATAQQIVGFRRAHGGFGSVEELDRVPGIGEKRLAGLRDQVRV